MDQAGTDVAPRQRRTGSAPALRAGDRQGDLPEGSDAADLAAYLSAILQGMAVQAAGGATREQLRRIAEMALRTWPPGLASV